MREQTKEDADEVEVGAESEDKESFWKPQFVTLPKTKIDQVLLIIVKLLALHFGSFDKLADLI